MEQDVPNDANSSADMFEDDSEKIIDDEGEEKIEESKPNPDDDIQDCSTPEISQSMELDQLEQEQVI